MQSIIKTSRIKLIFSFICLTLIYPVTAYSKDIDATKMRFFMFVSDYSDKGWDSIMAHPTDRMKDSAPGVEALGGKMLSYYFGLTDNKGYVTIQIPNDPVLIKGLHLMFLANGHVNSWTSVELMPADVFKQALEMGNVLRGKPELNEKTKK